MTAPSPLISLLSAALAARADLFDTRHEAAFRLFNGFTEGCSDLVVDLYARTLVLHNYADPPETAREAVRAAGQFFQSQLPWLQAVILKTRNGQRPDERRGVIIGGQTPDRKIGEHGIWYAIDLRLNRDASFYLDTRELRRWALDHLAGKTVLNTFAYTGSLGVAAVAGGALRVVHLDRSHAFLNLAKTSYTLNGFPIHKPDFIAGDFWEQVSRLKRAGRTFDCIFLDPPFFAESKSGTVDLNQSQRLINKVRPLVADGGWLVAVNNALFVSGADYMKTLEALCADGYLSIESLIPVPPDFAGYPATLVTPPLIDPAPFNHSTKIAILRVRRK